GVASTPGLTKPFPKPGQAHPGGSASSLSTKPSWAADISKPELDMIHWNCQQAIHHPAHSDWCMWDWDRRHPECRKHWCEWDEHCRHHHHRHHEHEHCFDHTRWEHHRHDFGDWHHHRHFRDHPWAFWWGRTAWGQLQPLASGGSQQPLSYDFGGGGSVTYEGNSVYMGGRRVASAEDFARSAADLATVPRRKTWRPPSPRNGCPWEPSY